VLSGVFHAPWEITVAPIYEYGSGQPWTHRLGYDLNGDGKNSDRCSAGLDTSFFSKVCPGGVTYDRNAEDGPTFRQFSLRLTKGLPAGAFGRVEVIAEAFNLFNNKNWDVNSVAAGEFLSGPTLANYRTNKTVVPAEVRNTAFGNYSRLLPNSQRQFQLGLRLVF